MILVTVDCWLTESAHFVVMNNTLNFCDIVHDNKAVGPHAPKSCPIDVGMTLFTYSDIIPVEFPIVSCCHGYVVKVFFPCSTHILMRTSFPYYREHTQE